MYQANVIIIIWDFAFMLCTERDVIWNMFLQSLNQLVQ